MDTQLCDEPYCVRHDYDAEKCTWPPHAVWCHGGCRKNVYGECTISLRDGNSGRGSGWHAFEALCAPDAATYVTGELDVHTVEQLDRAITSLHALRALLVEEEAFKVRRAAGISYGVAVTLP